MRTTPFQDIWSFFSGATDSHLGVGTWRWLLVAWYWLLVVASFYLARRNWRADPAQRSLAHVGNWLARIAIGSMWFEGSLWKLPIPSGGFQYWLEQEVQYAAFSIHRTLVKEILLPNFTAVNVVAFLSEMGMASAFILGLAMRGFGLFGMVFAAQLYFGLYLNPNEWPWEYIFIVTLSWLFLVNAAGRSLGLDALLRRETALGTASTPLARLYRLVS